MKRLFLLLSLVVMINSTFAQTYISMRPNWTFNPPQAENSTYEYYVSKGVGNTEKEARTDAFVMALKEAQSRVGVGANSTEIFKAFQASDKDFNVVASYYEIPMKEVCNFSEKSRDGNQFYYYQLLQVAVSGNITPNFRQFSGDCYDFSKAKELREIMKEEYKEKIEEDKRRQDEEAKLKAQEEELKKKEERKKRISNSFYWEDGKYVAWNIAGTGYPWNLTDGIEFRYGGVVGIGAYIDLGMDFTGTKFLNTYYSGSRSYTTKVFFHYGGGLKIFLFKGVFIDCGYGTINKPIVDVGWAYQPEGAREKVEYSHGLNFHAGYNLSNFNDDYTFFLGLSAGASYDVKNKVFAPSVLLKIGIAWDVE